MVNELQQTRAICYTFASCNRDTNKPFPSIQQFWPLPFDDESQVNETDEAARLQKIMEEYKKGTYGQRST
jgi:hypothetical protein